jgi:choline-glycine betaine transporter
VEERGASGSWEEDAQARKVYRYTFFAIGVRRWTMYRLFVQNFLYES